MFRFFPNHHLSVLIVALFISSCASQSPKTASEQTPITEKVISTDEVVKEDYVSLAEQAWLKNNDIIGRNALLINAAQEFSEQTDCARANLILSSIWPSLENPLHMQKTQLIKAECAILYIQNNAVPFTLIEDWINSVRSPELQARKEIVLAKLHALQENYRSAIRNLLPNANEASILNTQSAKDIWQWFSMLSEEDQRLVLNEFPSLSPYQELLSLIENTELTDLGRQQAIQFWRDNYSLHPLNTDFPIEIDAFTQQSLNTVRTITIMLPLTGRLEAQGDAIKQGVITAYLKKLEYLKQNDPAMLLPKVRFVDTGSDSDKLSADASKPDIYESSDLIIGPLLKEHISEVSRLNINNVPSIFLNRLDESADSISNALYFSLSPEDEAKQIARLMIDRGISTPVIINNGGALSERMKEAFLSTWETYGALQGLATADSSLLPQISFTNNKSMRIGITSALDVLQSQRRISQMEGLSSEVVHSVTRNRRDIDAFVVFALPDQIELINPIIEASISLFSETALPVFASSYSYQHQLNKNSIRDLRNLIFVDMPWLMPEQRESQLAKEVDNIWNQPSSSYLRLFAFGYDSFQFAERFGQLSFFKQNRLQGLSGELRINDKRQIVRELPVASVGQESIRLLE